MATNGIFTVAAFDSAGVMLSSRGWPRSLPAIPQGPPVVGQLRPGDAGRPEILVMLSSGLVALTDSARVLATFPKPGGAGSAPSLSDLDSTGATIVVAGTGSDSLLYFYSAGPGSAAGLPAPWPTPRGNFARTGSRLYAPPFTPETSSAPSAVNDLRAAAATESTITLQWTATADDGPAGRPVRYLIAVAEYPIDEANFGKAFHSVSDATLPPGGLESARIDGLERGRLYWFAIKAEDNEGNRSTLSNLIEARTRFGPLGDRTGVALASRTQPSRLPVELYWQGTGSAPAGTQFIRIFDLLGRQVRTLRLGAEAAAVARWDGRDDDANLVPAGLYFARLTSGSIHAQARVVLLP